jgi:hypothetical protein
MLPGPGQAYCGLPGVDKLDSHLTMKLIKSPEHHIAPPEGRA